MSFKKQLFVRKSSFLSHLQVIINSGAILLNLIN